MPPEPSSFAEYEATDRTAAEHWLSIMGGFHPAPDEAGLPPGTATLLLLAPREPGFWPEVSAAPEFRDGNPDPLDRWSRRVIGGWAQASRAAALFPFDGPPYLPFFDWARRTGHAWPSPVAMLVHDRAGLFLSIRGALALTRRIALPGAAPRPCDTCKTSPCRSACPVDALASTGYDLTACHRYLDTAEGTDCLENGCAARRVCPVSRRYPRSPAQSAFHMRAFHRMT
ncbi:ferredoxin [Tropicimonas sp.]|uniref:ferredoxin n=1 Tax=Tropicimonas sp. TaxID=2067044 RepID=UPI003A8ADE6B